MGVAWVIGWVAGRGELSEDTAIGVFFPTAMALGVVLMSLSPEYRQDLMGYLFGNILSVGPGQVLPLLAFSGATLGVPPPRPNIPPPWARPQFQLRVAPLGTYSRSPS